MPKKVHTESGPDRFTIAVVGAGPAGLASAALLLRSGQNVVVLERGEVGEAWGTRYDRLRLHTVRWLSSLPGYRMPRTLGKWPSRDSVIDYLRDYAVRSRITVRTGVEVEQIVRAAGRWRLRTSAGDVDADRVVVATGHNSQPYIPDWQGEFAGEIVHSADYRNAQPYAGRRVLVVGAGNSGAEIAVDIADGDATEVFLAVRTPPHIVRRDTLGFPTQVLGIATGHLPVPLVDRIASTMRRISVPNLAPYGLSAQRHPYSDFLGRRVIPIVDVGLVDAVQRGRVRVVAALDRFEGGAAVLADGTALTADAVVAATGYRTGLERIVGHLGVLDERGEPLVHGAEEHSQAPRLHFVGYQVTLGGTFRHIGIEAKQLARAVTRQQTQAPR